jgi:restriction system protein
MDPGEFENLVALTYEKQGYTVKLTGGSHDRGIDILAERSGGGGIERIAVQCKHTHGSVGRPVLQQLWGVVSDDHSITRGDLVTSGSFTSEARQFSSGKRLTLIDVQTLKILVQQLGIARFEEGLARSTRQAKDDE